MGEPDSMSTEKAMRQLALSVLGPSGVVPARTLRETGLHREFLWLHFQSIQPEIKNLVGWKPLREFGYTAHYRADSSERGRNATLTEMWLKVVDELGVADEHAVMIYDGEQRPRPAPDYRLFQLRDGRMMYYAGGLYGRAFGDYYLCGDILEVLDLLDKKHSAASCATQTSRQPFLIIVQALADVFAKAIRDRESKVERQKALLGRLNYAIQQVSAK